MPLVHGEHVSAACIEREVSTWGAERFTRLCNSIAWATAWPNTQELPAFTERVFVGDDGIDAEWSGELSAQSPPAGQLLRNGINVFQYKKREVTEATRRTLVSQLERELKGAFTEVERKTGKVLASYVLFTNIDLLTAQQVRLKRAIKHGLGRRAVHVEVIGAAGLAAMLNNLPHLRSAFFATSAFQTWGRSWAAHRVSSAFAETPLIGRGDIVARLIAMLEAPDVSVIALTGPHMMGKSRIALEATRSRDTAYVEALERRGPSIADLVQLASPGRTVIALVNDPDPETARELAAGVLASEGLKLILCLPTEDATPRLSFGLDERVRQLPVPPISDDDSRKLLSEAGAKFDFSLESWVIGNAGGVPGVLLAAAHVGAKLRTDAGSFIAQIADAFERELQRRVPAADMQAARAVALLSHLGVRDAAAAEATTVATEFHLDANAVLNATNRLSAAGFVRLEGSYAEVVPPPLANRLAAEFLSGRSAKLASCFAALDADAKRRLLRRLVQMTGEEANSFWNETLGRDGPFSSLEGIAANAELFQFASSVSWRQAAALLRRELEKHSVEERCRIEGEQRRNLVYAVEEMLFRETENANPFWCMALLAEAENESWSNNASGILKEVFTPLHPQVPLRLDLRLSVLADLISPQSSCALSALAADAIGDMLQFSTASPLRQSASAAPLGRTPEMMWSEVWDYVARSLELLARTSEDVRPAVRKRACQRLPRAVTNIIARVHPVGMPLLQALVERVLRGEPDVNVGDLGEAIRWCRCALRDHAHGGPQANEAAISELTRLHDRLLDAAFSIRLRFWLGGWYRDVEAPEEPVDEGERAITALAEEVVANPQLLDPASLGWASTEAERGHFFWREAGRRDGAGALRPVIANLARGDNTAHAFAEYLAGWRQRDAGTAADFFRSTAKEDGVSAHAILLGALAVEPADVAADRLVNLLDTGRIEGRFLMNVISGAIWQRNVSQQKLTEVLEAASAPRLENSGPVPRLLSYRSHMVPWRAGPLTDFAWRCLEARPSMVGQDDYYFDNIASRLARLDPDRAFRLLESSLADRKLGRHWNPISIGLPRNEFWKAISELDRGRTLATVLDAVRLGKPNAYGALFYLPNLVDMQEDAAWLINYARTSEDHAAVVCRAVVGGNDAFWPLAFRLVEIHPTRRIEDELTRRIEQSGQVIAGPISEHLRRCLAEIEAASRMATIPSRAGAWLARIARNFRVALEAQLRREADDRVNRG